MYRYLLFASVMSLSTLYCDSNEQPSQESCKVVHDEVLNPFSEESKSCPIGAVFEHYKGMRYKILAIGRHSESLEEMVVYQALYGEEDVWIRPLSMFLELVVIDGKEQLRFTRIS